MGCLKRLLGGLGCLVVLLALAAAAWMFRDRLSALYHRIRGTPVPPPVVYTMAAPGAASRGDSLLALLARPGGPAYVDLTAGELAGLIERQLGPAATRPLDSVAVALGEGRVSVRGSLDVSTLPHRLLGPLAEGLGRREPLVAGGTLAVVPGAHVVWTIDELRIRDFPFPRTVIPSIVTAIQLPGARGADVPLPLPRAEGAVGDVRVSPSAVRAYRASPR